VSFNKPLQAVDVKEILDSVFLRYAALSQRVQELAGIGNKGQSIAQLALQLQDKC